MTKKTADAINESVRQINEGKKIEGSDTAYWKKALAYIQKKFPGATADDLKQADNLQWSSGGNYEPPERIGKIYDLISEEDFIDVIGSDNDEFEEYCEEIGQA